jgi:site-specific recombinase XerD
MDRTKLKKLVKKYEEHLIVDRGLGRTTVEGYSRSLSVALRRMRKFCPSHLVIRQHILWMHKQEYSYHHIVNTSIALEHYCRFKGSTLRIGRPRKPKRIIKDTLTESEISRIIQATRSIREKALICLLAYSGMRNRELCNLRVEDIDLGSNRVKVIAGKNKKDRIINISAECSLVLIDYLRSHPRPKDRFLFTTVVQGNQLTPSDVRKTLRTAARRQLGNRRVYPHLMRHSLATNLLNRGASLIVIKEQLGHAFIDSTMIYVTSTAFRNRSEYEYFKPAYM